jgi:hypothetical protein
MKKKSPKRLILHRETLTPLSADALGKVGGQAYSMYQSCEVACPSYYTQCYGPCINW